MLTPCCIALESDIDIAQVAQKNPNYLENRQWFKISIRWSKITPKPKVNQFKTQLTIKHVALTSFLKEVFHSYTSV